MRKIVSEQQKDCDKHILMFLLAYRSAVHDSTSRSPAKVIFGTEIKQSAEVGLRVKPATEMDAAYIGNEESLNELMNSCATV